MTTLSVELGAYSSIVGISLHVKDETGRIACLLPLVNTGLGREGMITLATELQQAMAKGLLVAEREQLVAKNAVADAWGAAMGQRHERIQGIDKVLDYPPATPLNVAYTEISALGGYVAPEDYEARVRATMLDEVVEILERHGAQDTRTRLATS